MRGALFETAIVSEYLKHAYNYRSGLRINYWRERSGQEVDLILETPHGLRPVEIKSGATVTRDMLTGLRRWVETAGSESVTPAHVYGGIEGQRRSDVTTRPWRTPVTLADEESANV